MKPWSARLAAVVALAAAVLVGPHATAASAHAGLVSSTPQPATGLAQAPGAVVLRFSEPLNLRLSRVEVTGPGGEDATAGPTVAVEGDPRAMRRTLGLLAPGQYRVRWTTVSTLDGHTLHGSFGFAIGSEVGAPEALRATPISSEGPLGLLGRQNRKRAAIYFKQRKFGIGFAQLMKQIGDVGVACPSQMRRPKAARANELTSYSGRLH